MTDEKNNQAAESEEAKAFRDWERTPWPVGSAAARESVAGLGTATHRVELAFREGFRAARALWQKQYDDGSVSAPNVQVKTERGTDSYTNPEWVVTRGHLNERMVNQASAFNDQIRRAETELTARLNDEISALNESVNERLARHSRTTDDVVSKHVSEISHRIDLVTSGIFQRLSELEGAGAATRLNTHRDRIDELARRLDALEQKREQQREASQTPALVHGPYVLLSAFDRLNSQVIKQEKRLSDIETRQDNQGSALNVHLSRLNSQSERACALAERIERLEADPSLSNHAVRIAQLENRPCLDTTGAIDRIGELEQVVRRLAAVFES